MNPIFSHICPTFIVCVLLYFSACSKDEVKCVYMAGKDKMLFTDGFSVGLRKDLNGMLLLDTALQTPVRRTEDIVKVELPLPEVGYFILNMLQRLTKVVQVNLDMTDH